MQRGHNGRCAPGGCGNWPEHEGEPVAMDALIELSEVTKR